MDASPVATTALEAGADTSARVPHQAAAEPDAKAWALYWVAMKRGRAATVRKTYPEAITAFTEALAAVPRDARAMSERGYAKFLAGDNHGAQSDLDAAVDRVPANDKKLSAQVYFNEGLVADQAGATEAAATYYRQSYELNPTAAAKAKMSACPVTVEAFSTVVVRDRPAALASIASGADFKRWDYSDDGRPIVAAFEFELDRAYAVLAVGSGFAVVRTDQDVAMGPKGPSADVGAERAGAEWIVTGQAEVPGEMACVAEGPCMQTGNVEGGTHDVYYVDAVTGAGLWHVSFDRAFVDRIVLSVVVGGLHVDGAGCALVKSR